MGLYIGKLLIAHFNGLFKNLLAGRVRKAIGVVDGLGYGVAGHAQLIRDVLYGNSPHGGSLLVDSGVL
jgi:hypothetical protein